jgi:hypothetical protein
MMAFPTYYCWRIIPRGIKDIYQYMNVAEGPQSALENVQVYQWAKPREIHLSGNRRIPRPGKEPNEHHGGLRITLDSETTSHLIGQPKPVSRI